MTYQHVKRIVDICVAAVGLVVIAPALVIMALVVKIDSRGPLFYRGVRTGLNGERFRIFKFRTMVCDAEQVGGGTTRLNDPRVTRTGRVMRRWKLDEFPQLINVLVGEMSFVGPRPELPQYTDQYDDDEQIILSVRPGITDISSLQFISLDETVGAGDADAMYENHVLKEKNRLRRLYVEKQGPALDARIFTATLMSLARGKRSANTSTFE